MSKPTKDKPCHEAQNKRRAWVTLTQLPPHLYGKRRSTQIHQNRLRLQRMGRSKYRKP